MNKNDFLMARQYYLGLFIQDNMDFQKNKFGEKETIVDYIKDLEENQSAKLGYGKSDLYTFLSNHKNKISNALLKDFEESKLNQFQYLQQSILQQKIFTPIDKLQIGETIPVDSLITQAIKTINSREPIPRTIQATM